MEIWCNISKLNDKYSVSNYGNIRNNKTSRILKQYVNHSTGYSTVTVRLYGKHGGSECIRVHREVAIAFLPNPYNLPQVNHIDCNKTNNHMNNLEWCTAKENTVHAVTNNLIRRSRGHLHVSSKLTKDDREFILKHYSKNNSNYTGRALAERFNVDKMQIYRVIRRGF